MANIEHDELALALVAAASDLPSVYMGGPSHMAKRRAADALDSLTAAGFRIVPTASRIVDKHGRCAMDEDDLQVVLDPLAHCDKQWPDDAPHRWAG